MHRAVFTAFALTVITACSFADSEMTDYQKAEIAAEVELRLDQLWDVLRNPDADLLLSFFHESEELISVHDGAAVLGYATFEQGRPIVDEWENQVVTVSETRTVVLSRDIAYTLRVGTDSLTFRSGDAVPTRPWAVTYVWIRSDGEWKILLGHGSHPSPLNP